MQTALSRIPSDQHDIVHDEFPVSLVSSYSSGERTITGGY